MVDIKSIDAANAYASTIKNQSGASSSDGIGSIGNIGSIDGADEGKGTFSDLLTSAIEGTSGAVGQSENIGIQAMNNNADLVDVVTTVQNAEMVLQTVVSVRDKVISALSINNKVSKMNGADVIDVAQDAIWVIIKVAGPVMLIALVVGLIVSLFQALTQIQEMTLTFVPKIIAIFFSLLIFLPYMADTLGAFMQRIAERIVGLV